MNEADMEKRLKTKIKEREGLAFKLVSPGNAGVPDRLVLFKGARAVFVELKAPGKKLRALQIKRKKQIEELDFKVYTIDSDEEIDRLLREMDL